MKTPPRAIPVLALLALVLATTGCGAGGGYDTPQASFQTLRMAAHHKDIAAVAKSLTAESQDVIVGALVATGVGARLQSAANPTDAALAKHVEAFNPVLAKHGVTDETVALMMLDLAKLAMNPKSVDPAVLASFAKPIKDKVAFTTDMYAAMEKLGEVNFGEEFYEQLAGELKDVKIEGERATATVVTKTGQSPLEFHKTPEGWKLHVKTENFAPQTGAASAG